MLNNKTVLLNKVLYSRPAGVLRLMGIGFIRTPIFFLSKARLHYFVLMPRSSLHHEAVLQYISPLYCLTSRHTAITSLSFVFLFGVYGLLQRYQIW